MDFKRYRHGVTGDALEPMFLFRISSSRIFRVNGVIFEAGFRLYVRRCLI